MKTYVGISRDHSMSMSSIARAAVRDYNSLIESIKNNAQSEVVDTIVNVVKCGVGHHGKNIMDVVNSNIYALEPITERDYITDGHSTPLFDSVGMLIEMLEKMPDYDNKDVNFLIMAVTDGEDNASYQWRHKIGQKIRQLQATDRWTFVFRIPRGYKRELMSFDIPEGNILEWDQTEEGVRESTVRTETALRSFYQGTKSGITSTTSFYNTDLSGVTTKQVKSKLVDISKDVEIWRVNPEDHGRQIRDFCEQHLTRPMKRGSAFYLLMKPEKEVQDYKQIVIRDKKNGCVYCGANARQLLGLPYSGTVKVVPGNHGAFDIFIQSTSVNRKLVGGTQVLYWDKVGEEYLTSSSPLGPVAPTKSAPKFQLGDYVRTKDNKDGTKNRVGKIDEIINSQRGWSYSVNYSTKPFTYEISEEGLVKDKKPVAPKKKPVATYNPPIQSKSYIDGYKEGFIDGKNKKKLDTSKAPSFIPGNFVDGYTAGYKDGRGKKKNLYK